MNFAKGNREYRQHVRYAFFRAVLCAVLAIGASIGIHSSASAAAAPSSGALRVSPALSNIQLSSSETSTTVVATVTNMTSNPLVIDMSVRDFGTLADMPGSISFYGPGYNPSTNTHGLQTVTSLASPQITLAPHESQKVAITLSNLSKLAPGGHYDTVLFNPESLTAQSGKPKVSIQSAVASLIFLKTATGGTQNVQLQPFSTGSVRFSLPSTTYLNFSNSGNTQAAPQGQLTLYGSNGSILSTTVINPGSGLILPGSSRLFTELLPVSNTWRTLPGEYRLELKYRSNTQSTFTVINERFFYLNLALLIPLLIVTVLLVYVLKRMGRRLLRGVRWLVLRLARLFKRKKRTPPEPPKPKNPPRLIQG